MTFAWEHAEIATQVIGKVMQGQASATRESLWTINKQYYQQYGAQNAQLLSMLPSALDCSPQENDYQFQHSILFENEGEVPSGNILIKLLKGVSQGKIKISTLRKLIQAALLGNKIFKHYQNYPETTPRFENGLPKQINYGEK